MEPLFRSNVDFGRIEQKIAAPERKELKSVLSGILSHIRPGSRQRFSAQAPGATTPPPINGDGPSISTIAKSSMQATKPKIDLDERLSTGNSFDIFQTSAKANRKSRGEPLPSDIADKFLQEARFAQFTPLGTQNDSKLLLKNCAESKIKEDVINQLKNAGFRQSENGVFYNVKTGTSFIVMIDSKNNKISAYFGGLGSEGNIEGKDALSIIPRMALANTSSAVRDFLGGNPSAAKEAMNLGLMFREVAEQNNYTPVIIGHSHGGGLAACAADAAGIKGVIFNARPIGAGVRKSLEEFKQEHQRESIGTITAFVTEKDWVAHQDGILYKVASLLKKEKRPVSIAHETWIVPKPKGNSIARHNDIAEPIYRAAGKLKNKSDLN